MLFCCSVAIKIPNGEVNVFVVKADGKLVWFVRGCGGLDADFVFVPFGSSVIYDKMTFVQKSAGSHRFRATLKPKDYISSCKKNTSVV